MAAAVVGLVVGGGGVAVAKQFIGQQPTTSSFGVQAPQNPGQQGSGQQGFGSGQRGFGGQPGDSSGGQSGGSGFGGPLGRGDMSTTQSNASPATAAQSRGVVLIASTLDGGEGLGTGMVLSSDGDVLTNYHVVQGSTTVKVTIASTGRSYTAKVVGSSESNDIALLKLQGASGLSTITIDHDQVGVGDSVAAVGNAGGQNRLTNAPGQVTELNQQITATDQNGSNAEQLTGLIETNADVVPGDSGGPLYDSQGEVMGINSAASANGPSQGYAIPIDKALTIVKQIESGQSNDSVRVGANAYLGVELANTQAGATIANAVSGGPAATAGIASGDVINAVDGTQVSSADELRTAIVAHQPGEKVSISWTAADGTSHTATVTLAESPIN